MNPSSGMIAASTKGVVHIYRPEISKDRIQWVYCLEFSPDGLHINSLSWGNSTEIAIGTDKNVVLLSIAQNEDLIYGSSIIWQHTLPNPCYILRFSRNSELIACVLKYDKLVKFFYRTNYADSLFNMISLRHSDYVTDLKFRYIDQSKNSNAHSSNYNILYTISNDSYVRVFLSFEFEKAKKVQHWGSLKLTDSSLSHSVPSTRFVKIIDNFFFDYMVNRSLKRFLLTSALLKQNLQRLMELELDLIMVVDNKGHVSFYLVVNLNLNPPKSILFKKLSFDESDGGGTLSPSSIASFSKGSTVEFPDGVFPSNPTDVYFSDSIKIYKKARHKNITFANYKEYELSEKGELSDEGDLAFVIHDLTKKSLRYVYLRLDNLLQNINFTQLFDTSLGSLAPSNASSINFKKDQIPPAHVKKPFLSSSASVRTSPSFLSLRTPSVAPLLAPSVSQTITLEASLGAKISGHAKSIQRMFKDLAGDAALSVSRFSEHKLWVPLKLENGRVTLQRKCVLHTPKETVLGAVLVNSGAFIVLYTSSHKLSLWRTKDLKYGEKLHEITQHQDGMTLLSFFHVPEHRNDLQTTSHLIVGIFLQDAHTRTMAWRVDTAHATLVSFPIDPLPCDQLQAVSAVDPVGWYDLLDDYARDVLTVITAKGTLLSFSVSVGDSNVKWVELCSLETAITNASAIKGSSLHKVAITSGKTLNIYNTTSPMLEFSETFTETVIDLDWTDVPISRSKSRNTPSMLSVGFASSVLIFSQLNFDYTNSLPSFAPVKKIDLSHYTAHVLNDSTWLGRGLLVIGSGNQLFVADTYTPGLLSSEMVAKDSYTRKIVGDRSLDANSIDSICGLVSILNNTLPVYHPQMIVQCIYHGKMELVKKVFLRLYLFLKEISISDDSSVKAQLRNLSSTLGIPISDFYGAVEAETSSEIYTLNNFINWSPKLRDILTEISLPVLTRHQQITLLTVVEAVEHIEKSRPDVNGANFILGYYLFRLHFKTQRSVNTRDTLFALRCADKNILLSVIGSRNTWQKCKRAGMALWLDHTQLSLQFEQIAHTEFLASEDASETPYFENGRRSPINSTIFYLALRKKPVLEKLWRICHGHPEQQKMVRFLGFDFNNSKHRLSAQKNAFALLSKHRPYLAACFFLLGDKLKDCVNVLVKKCEDIDLAIAVARVYEGNTVGPVLTSLLLDFMLPTALKKGDRWLMTYIFHSLGEERASLMSLVVSPPEALKHSLTFVGEDLKPSLELSLRSYEKGLVPTKTNIVSGESMGIAKREDSNNIFLKIDPISIIVYQEFRDELLKKTGLSKLALEAVDNNEFKFVNRIALIYSRMGCDYLSIHILRNWRFTKYEYKETEEEKSLDTGKFKLFDVEKPPPPPEAFQEFDMGAFGF